MMGSMSDMTDTDVMELDLDFVCPRCGGETTSAYYGPCLTCRDQLRATYAATAREVEAVAYEPKMNVVPNQIATKE